MRNEVTPMKSMNTVSASGTVLPMANRQQVRRGGRPSKGDRHPFHVRVPRPYADRIIAYAEAVDMTNNDVLLELIVRHIDELDVDALEHGTNTLPLEKSA